jgi:hypothetical protein
MLNRKLFSFISIFVVIVIGGTVFADQSEKSLEIKHLIANSGKYDGVKVNVKAFVFLKKIEDKSLFSCDSNNAFFEQNYIFLDLFTEEPNNENHIRLNKEASEKYERYKRFDQSCAKVEGTFHMSKYEGREAGRIVVENISELR